MNISISNSNNTLEYCILSTTSSEYKGIRPILCAKNSSNNTVVFDCISTQSIASVGTSAIQTRRKALATLLFLKFFSLIP